MICSRAAMIARAPRLVKHKSSSPHFVRAGLEPSVPREQVCPFREHVHSLQSVRRPLHSKWYSDDSDGPLLFGLNTAEPIVRRLFAGGRRIRTSVPDGGKPTHASITFDRYRRHSPRSDTCARRPVAIAIRADTAVGGTRYSANRQCPRVSD